MPDNRNLILAVVLSVAILIGFQVLNPRPVPPPPEAGRAESVAPAAPGVVPGVPAAPSSVAGGALPTIPGSPRAKAGDDRAAALAASPRVRIRSPRLTGSIALTGARIDDLTLLDYRETLDPESPRIVLLSPDGLADAYYAQFGWAAADGVAVPGAETPWAADRRTLAPGNPVTLRWDNGQGLSFVRTYALDDDYMFTITQRVQNASGEAVTLYPYALVARHGTPEVTPLFILHEGLLGVLDGTLQEVDYDDLQEEKAGRIEQTSTGGWVGITGKYWLTAVVPDQKAEVQVRFIHRKVGGADRYQADYTGAARRLVPGARVEVLSHFFAGAKEVVLLDGYERTADGNPSWFDSWSAPPRAPSAPTRTPWSPSASSTSTWPSTSAGSTS